MPSIENYEAIDYAIRHGVTSVDMVEFIQNLTHESPRFKDRGKLVAYIVNKHMDDEMMMHLMDEYGYDPMFHRLAVDSRGEFCF